MQTDEATTSLLAPFARDVLLATGRPVHVRPAAPSDIERLGEFYEQLDEHSMYLRFFSLRRSIPDDELARATVHDVSSHVTLVTESDGELIGVGSYDAAPGEEEAEVAFTVADDHHHEGIATVLLEDLALIARAAGFRRLGAETLPENAAMLGVFRTVGLVHRLWFEDGVVRVQLDLTADDILQDDADLRDWKAAVRSLRSIVEPSHVVVIGAGDDATASGRRVLAHLRATFTGRISVVHPSAQTVGGIAAVGDVGQLDAVPDLAVIALAAAEVAAEVARCGAAGVRSAVVLSTGFAESGPAGARLQDDALAAARRFGMRLVGPNCLGVVSTACGLNATFTSQTFLPGGIAIASQSGGVGIAIAAEAHRRHAGISSFVSMGNKADVSSNDLLRLWADDELTRVVLLYLESFGDPVRFARVARAVSRRKPVVALKSGRTAAGQRVALAHTAAIASDHTIVDALFTHTGVVRARTLEELVDVGLLLDRQPVPAGRRIALVGNAGGPLVLGADAADGGGLDVPMLSTALQDDLSRTVPLAASTTNPVDLGADVTPDQLASIVQAIGRSGEVDACVVVFVEVGEQRRLDEVASLLSVTDVAGVTLALSLIGAGERDGGSLPTFPTPERAAAAVALAARSASVPDETVEVADDISLLDATALVDARRLARRHAGGRTDVTWIDAPSSLELLAAAGVPVAPSIESADSLELLVGVTRDPAFGPVVVVGAGGIDAELRDDQVALIAPVGAAGARRAIESLRLAPLLHGFRGRPELPVDTIVEVVQRVALLAAAVPEIQQLDINPLLVDPKGCGAADATVAVATPRAAVVPVRGLRGRASPR